MRLTVTADFAAVEADESGIVARTV